MKTSLPPEPDDEDSPPVEEEWGRRPRCCSCCSCCSCRCCSCCCCGCCCCCCRAGEAEVWREREGAKEGGGGREASSTLASVMWERQLLRELGIEVGGTPSLPPSLPPSASSSLSRRRRRRSLALRLRCRCCCCCCCRRRAEAASAREGEEEGLSEEANTPAGRTRKGEKKNMMEEEKPGRYCSLIPSPSLPPPRPRIGLLSFCSLPSVLPSLPPSLPPSDTYP